MKTYHLVIYRMVATGIDIYGTVVKMRAIGEHDAYRDFRAKHPLQKPGDGSFKLTKFEVVVYDNLHNPKGMNRTDDITALDVYPVIKTCKEA